MRMTAMRNPMGRKSYIRYNDCCVATRCDPSCLLACIQYLYPMVSNTAKEVFIQGITHEGKTFRPSDWAERLAGVMSQFRPGGVRPGSHLSYSPWCIPTSVGGVKCVVVHPDLRSAEPLAWEFCMNFAKDNELQMFEAWAKPDALTE